MPDTAAHTMFSLATVKTWLKITNMQTGEDDRLAIAADAASDEIERETSVQFVIRSMTEKFDGKGQRSVVLKRAPVASLASITVDGSALSASDYNLDTDLGIIELTNYRQFAYGQKNIVVSYTAGYDKKDGPNLPSDVYRAGLDLTKAIYDELARNAIAVSTVSMGPTTTVIKTTKRPLSVQRVIDNWKSARIV